MSRMISVAELKSRLDRGAELQLVDVRSISEYASGHVPGAVNIPMNQVESRLGDLSLRSDVVLICQGGTRAAITAGWLCQRREAVVLEGGTQAWKAAGLPLVECTSCRWSLERQVRFVAGLLVATGAVLALTVSPLWAGLSLFVGSGLTFAGLTDFCPMGILLAKMPWNRDAKTGVSTPTEASSCCS